MQQYQPKKESMKSFMCVVLNGVVHELNRYGLYDKPVVNVCSCLEKDGDHVSQYQRIYYRLSDGGKKFFDDYLTKQVYRLKTEDIRDIIESENLSVGTMFRVFHKTVTYEYDEEDEMYPDFLLNYIRMKHQL